MNPKRNIGIDTFETKTLEPKKGQHSSASKIYFYIAASPLFHHPLNICFQWNFILFYVRHLQLSFIYINYYLLTIVPNISLSECNLMVVCSMLSESHYKYATVIAAHKIRWKPSNIEVGNKKVCGILYVVEHIHIVLLRAIFSIFKWLPWGVIPSQDHKKTL